MVRGNLRTQYFSIILRQIKMSILRNVFFISQDATGVRETFVGPETFLSLTESPDVLEKA